MDQVWKENSFAEEMVELLEVYYPSFHGIILIKIFLKFFHRSFMNEPMSQLSGGKVTLVLSRTSDEIAYASLSVCLSHVLGREPMNVV